MPRNPATLAFVFIVVLTGLLEGTVRLLSQALPELIPFEYKTQAWHTFDNPDHATLLILHIPDPIQMDPARAAMINARDGYSTLYPNRRLERFAASLGIPYVSLYEPFAAARDHRGLRPPYFSFRCDPHWSPLGHELAAQVIADYLIRTGFLPAIQQEPEAR